MLIIPTEPIIPEETGFTDENDIFGYREFGKRLANLVSNVDEPLVIILNAPWGSGKSVFIKQWAGMLRERGGSVVYFDAFGNDIHDDAFLSLASEIHSLAKKTLSEDKSEEFLDIAGKVGKALAPVGLRIATRFVTFGSLNPEDIEAGGKAIKDMVKTLGNEDEQSISEKIRKVDEERASLKKFRGILENVSKAIIKKNQKDKQHLPLIFIVDELDRCRPPFALDIIERVKHLFSVQNVCFVLVTHLPHLIKTVEGAYGASFDAGIYLEKFYHLMIKLPEPNNEDGIQRNKYLDHLWGILGPKFRTDSVDQIVREEIRRLANAHELSLRRIERALTHVVLSAASINENQPSVPPVLAGLCIMRQTHPDLYKRAQKNNLTWDDVKGFLMIDMGSDGSNTRRIERWMVDWWKYFVDPENVSEETMKQYSSSLERYNWLNMGHPITLRTFTDYIESLAGDYSRE